MTMTHNEALDLLAQGNEDAAWAMAQRDEGLNPNATRDMWLAFARGCLETRREISAANAHQAWQNAR